MTALQQLIDQKNKEASRGRQKQFARKNHLVQTDRQAMELVVERFQEFSAQRNSAEAFAALGQAVRLMEKRMQQ